MSGVSMEILDNYLFDEKVQALNELHIEYAKVHWIGYEYNSKKNPLIDLVLSTKPVLQDRAHGATAWYNVRPIDPVWHSDILSYNDKLPTNHLPERTFVYYMREPDSGGHLEIGGKTWSVNETIEPKVNRLVYFDATLTHRVQPYEGNRVSISWVWWKTVPDRYDPVVLTNTSYHVLERFWT